MCFEKNKHQSEFDYLLAILSEDKHESLGFKAKS